jgi:hypothetical protein
MNKKELMIDIMGGIVLAGIGYIWLGVMFSM